MPRAVRFNEYGDVEVLDSFEQGRGGQQLRREAPGPYRRAYVGTPFFGN